MIYFKIKSELQELKDFREDVVNFWKIRGELGLVDLDRIHSHLRKAEQHAFQKSNIKNRPKEYKSYEVSRGGISKSLPKVVKISRKLGINTEVSSVPPPALGGIIISQNIFMAIIKDSTYGGIDKQLILDTIDMTIGECERRINDEFYKLINPFYWLLSLIKFIIRIPFLILEASGFNGEKIEENYFGKIIKLLSILIYIILLSYFGFKSNILDLLKSFISN